MMDFGSILAQIWTQFWLISELILGLKTGPLRGPVLSETPMKYNGFCTSRGSKRTPFRSQFRCHFDIFSLYPKDSQNHYSRPRNPTKMIGVGSILAQTVPNLTHFDIILRRKTGARCERNPNEIQCFCTRFFLFN